MMTTACLILNKNLFSAFLCLSLFCSEYKRNVCGTLIDSIDDGGFRWEG